MTLKMKKQAGVKQSKNRPIEITSLAEGSTPAQIESSYHDALLRDAEDVQKRTQGYEQLSFHDGTAEVKRVYYSGMQGLGIKGDKLVVNVRPATDKEKQTIDGTTHIVNTNITSGVRWKRQLKILKDLIGNDGVVTHSYTGTAYIRLGDKSFISKPKVTTEIYSKKIDITRYCWVRDTTQADLEKLGVRVIDKEKDGAKWYFLITVEDAQRVAVDGWRNPFSSVSKLIEHQKIAANRDAESGMESYPYPEVISEEYRDSIIASHEAKIKREAEFQEEQRRLEEQKPKTKKRASGVTCPVCGGPMISRSGKYGRFYGCARYPECRGTRRGR